MAGLANDNNPFQSQVRLGLQYIQLVPGPPGPDGTSAAAVLLTANFTQPAVSSNVAVQVTTTATLAQGLNVFVAGGGFYAVASVADSTHATLTNLGSAGNLGPGGTVLLGGIVEGSGPGVAPLVVQSNGGAITQRTTLDIEGLTYSDTGSAMKFVAMVVQSNGGSITQRPILDLHGLVFTDTGTSMRFDSFADLGTPVVNPVVTLTTTQTWILFDGTGQTFTLPATPVNGRVVNFTLRSGPQEVPANQVTLNANGNTIVPFTDVLASPAATTKITQTASRYAIAFDGSVWRWV